MATEERRPAAQPLAKPSDSFRLRSPSLNAVRLRRVFDIVDSDGDGDITAAEISAALERLGLGASDPDEIGLMIAPFLPAGKPALDFDAFCEIHRSLGDSFFGEHPGGDGASEEEVDMEEAFKVFDEDGDGFISAAELQDVLGKLGLEEGKSIDGVRRMICSVDENHDGRVDLAEFKHMMRGIAVTIP